MSWVRQYKIDYIILILWQLFLAIPFLFSRDISVYSFVHYIIFNNAALFVGVLIFSSLLSKLKIPGYAATGLFIFLGYFILSLLLLVNSSLAYAIIIAISLLLFVIIDYKKNIQWDIHLIIYGILAIVICFIFFNKSNMLYHIGRTYPEVLPEDVYTWMDPYFFTSIVSTLKDSSIFSAIYEKGTPISYHFFGYTPAAILSEFTGFTSYFTLYTLWIPFLYLLLMIFLSVIPKVLFNTEKIIYGAVCVGSFLLFQPIHHSELLFNIPSTGSGYLFPNIHAGTDVAMIFISLFAVIGFSNIQWNTFSIREKIMLILILAALSITKQPAFFIVFVWFGFMSLWEIYHKRFTLIIMLAATAVITVIINHFFIPSEYIARKAVIDPFYLFEYVSKYAHHPINNVTDWFWVGGIFLVLILLWGNFRWWILYKSLKEKKYQVAVFAYLLLFVITLLLVNVLKIEIDVEIPGVALEGSFDLMQFVKFNFYFLSVIACIVFTDSIMSDGIKSLGFARWFLGLYLIISFSGIIYSMRSIQSQTIENDWLSEVKKGLNNKSEKVCIVNPINKFEYTGALIASDLGIFWVSITPENGAYNFNLKNKYRWDLLRQLFNTSVVNHKEILTQIVNEEKTVLFIATPDDINKYLELVRNEKIFTQDKECKWLFYPNNEAL